ncbi:MAG: SDR family NAD(P)-dependent oxidoreductase [Lachnospiraceae bacterium]|nr:SDR family NAD(P)-dependent oxidoreductase [Lachnospiraceae bacterium]
MKEFKGKTALITGAAYGFGKEFVKQAAMRGMKIVAVDIMGDELAKLEDIAKECGAEDITLITADVGIYEETEKVVNTALEKYGTIDILMNNAGVAVPGNGYNLPLRDWEWIVQTNFMSHVYFMRQVIPIMIKQGTHCNIMNTCSVAGVINWIGMVPYYATKHAAVALAESINYELQAIGADIAMGVFCPGYVQTNLDHSEWYRPERFKDDTDPYYQSEEFKKGQAEAKHVIETGLPIEGHAEQVWEAIEEDRFYVLPHEKYDGFLKLQTAEKLQRKSPNLKEVMALLKGGANK